MRVPSPLESLREKNATFGWKLQCLSTSSEKENSKFQNNIKLKSKSNSRFGPMSRYKMMDEVF